MKESPGIRVGVVPGAEPVPVGDPPPGEEGEEGVDTVETLDTLEGGGGAVP